MSNKIVPEIYRIVIDDVVQAIKSEFDEYGVSEDVLADLQTRWEQKVIASNVADFEQTGQQSGVKSGSVPPPPPPPQNGITFPNQGSFPQPFLPGQVKAEPLDNRYVLQNLPGPQLNLPSFGGPAPISRPGSSQPPSQQRRIPQVDGTADDGDSDEDGKSQPKYASRSSHPSLPKPAGQSSSSSRADVADSEAINSDLDDSDTADDEDAEDAGDAATDIVFCTYDKVARVKNKWKCVLKDGMVHVNGKDYLFAKCSGEFEW